MRLRASTMMALLLVAGLLCVAVLPAPVVESKLSARIEVSQSWTPKKPEVGQGVTFTIYIKNKQAEPMMVTYIGVHMDWQASTAYYETISAATLAPGQGASFTVSFAVAGDARIGNHDYTMRIDYTVAGTPYSEKSDKVSNFEVFETTTADGGGGGGGGNPLMLVLGIGVPVIVVLVVVIIIVKTRSDKHRKRSAVIKARSAPKDAAAEQPSQPGGAAASHPDAAVAMEGGGGAGPPQPQPATGTPYGPQVPPPVTGPTSMPAKPPAPIGQRPLVAPPGTTPMPQAPPRGKQMPGASGGTAVPMPAKPPTPFGIVRSPKQATPGEETKAVPEGACGNCGAPVKGRVCTVCGSRVM